MIHILLFLFVAGYQTQGLVHGKYIFYPHPGPSFYKWENRGTPRWSKFFRITRPMRLGVGSVPRSGHRCLCTVLLMCLTIINMFFFYLVALRIHIVPIKILKTFARKLKIFLQLIEKGSKPRTPRRPWKITSCRNLPSWVAGVTRKLWQFNAALRADMAITE